MQPAIERTIYNDEHQMFQDSVRKFMENEIAPHTDKWEEQGYVDRDAWLKAGANGFLCATMPEEFGGSNADRKYSAILMEEQARIGSSGPGFSLHSDIVAPYILAYGSDYLKQIYLPAMARGEMIGAIAMSEPAAGSDLQGVKTSAVKQGDHYVLKGSKTFITNGWNADVVIVVAKTNPQLGAKGTSLFLVDTSMAGFTKGRRLKKVGMKAQDTSELFFDDVKVPAVNLLGAEGQGFVYLMQELAWERLQIAITAVAACEAAIDWTVKYTRERQAFGKSIMDFQNTKFKLAEMKTETQIARVFVDKCIELTVDGKLDATTGAMAKYWTTDLQNKVIDECVQLHGGYGYMWEYPIARAFADARVQRIYGGTNEIMKELISRTL